MAAGDHSAISPGGWQAERSHYARAGKPAAITLAALFGRFALETYILS